MPPTTWDVPTFAQQQQDIDEIDTALPALETERNELLKERAKLEDLLDRRASATSESSNGGGDSNCSNEAIAGKLKEIANELARNASQRRGRLILAKGCEEANRKMLEDVSVEFLTKAEKEQLGALRLKLSRILFQYGSE